MPSERPKPLKRKIHSWYCGLLINVLLSYVLQQMYSRGHHWRIIFSPSLTYFSFNHKYYGPILHCPPSLVELRAEFAADWTAPCSVPSFKPQRGHWLSWRRFTLMSQSLEAVGTQYFRLDIGHLPPNYKVVQIRPGLICV